ncbi:MAG: hypothetical protein LBB20_03360 [Puniceicoccales bacterium]|jgi:hypothetical protein|nr:hypothetical protein [Puniceicoccales bacterium]
MDRIGTNNSMPQPIAATANKNGIGHVNASNCSFHFLKLRKGLGGAPNIETSPLENKSVSSANKANSMLINSMDDKATIARSLINKVKEEESILSNGKNSLTSRRKPGSQVCLKVLSDLIAVAEANGNKNQVFCNKDMKNLITIFCPDKLGVFENMDVTSEGQMKGILNEIKNGINGYIGVDNALPERVPSKSQCKSLENVMASTLQSMSGVGRTGYKNMTICGRSERLATIGKVLKVIGSAVAIGAMVTAGVLSGGTLFAIGGVAISLNIAVGGGAALGGLAVYLAGSNTELNARANADIPFKARLMCTLANAASYISVVGSISHIVAEFTDINIPLLGTVVSKLDNLSRVITYAAEMSIQIQSFMAMVKDDLSINNKYKPELDIDFKEMLDALKSNDSSRIVNKIFTKFSGILNEMPDDKMCVYSDKMCDILESISHFVVSTDNATKVIGGELQPNILSQSGHFAEVIENAVDMMNTFNEIVANNTKSGTLDGGKDLFKDIFSILVLNSIEGSTTININIDVGSYAKKNSEFKNVLTAFDSKVKSKIEARNFNAPGSWSNLSMFLSRALATCPLDKN